MSSSILRNGLTSPARAAMKRPSNMRSILRRPAPVVTSPNPLPFANFSSLMSPGIKSPHVMFMASPELVATYATHSSDTYDRAPIRVSPNPLELPGRGQRYHSPSMATFKLSPAPKPKASVQKRLDSILRNAQSCASPAITDFEDPRSPRLPVESTGEVRFASFAEPEPARPLRDLGKSLSSYPRSPYPSAPLSPAGETTSEARGRRMSDSSVDVSTRTRSVEGTAPRKAPVARISVPFTPIPSPLKHSFKTPTTAGLQRAHKPAPLALEPKDDSTALSDEFWNAVSLGVEGETPMVTALEYPESAMEMEEVDLKSPGPAMALKSPAAGPALTFGTQDGSVWSPSPAVKQTPARESLLRSTLMSPGKAAFGRVKRSFIASPSPNDPFASFPSFAAVLTMAPSDPAIAYPAPVATAA